MQPTQVRVGTMDAPPGPEAVFTIPARHLGVAERVWRAAGRLLGVSGVLLFLGNLGLLMIPVPHLHLCLFPLAFILGPIISYVAWRDRVVLAQTELPCPRCHDAVTVPEGVCGWPARFNCERCGIMVELKAA